MNKSIKDLPLINFRISLHCPAPTRKDKKKEDELTAQSGAERGAIRVQAERIPEKFQKPISACQAKIRSYFEKNSFRLNDSYAIPVKQYDSFMVEVNRLMAEHDVYVNRLCEAIDSGEIVEEARRRMGADFDPAFVPASCDAVKSAIKVVIRPHADLTSPVIASALADLAEDTRNEVETKVREEMERAENEGQTSIVSFVMDEVREYLVDIATRCDEGAKGTHYKTLLDKFVRITQKLPAYNVTGNPAVSNAIERVYEAFKTLDKTTLKNSEDYRRKQVETAKTILADIQDGSLF
jgi:hypothetical protein